MSKKYISKFSNSDFSNIPNVLFHGYQKLEKLLSPTPNRPLWTGSLNTAQMYETNGILMLNIDKSKVRAASFDDIDVLKNIFGDCVDELLKLAFDTEQLYLANWTGKENTHYNLWFFVRIIWQYCKWSVDDYDYNIEDNSYEQYASHDFGRDVLQDHLIDRYGEKIKDEYPKLFDPTRNKFDDFIDLFKKHPRNRSNETYSNKGQADSLIKEYIFPEFKKHGYNVILEHDSYENNYVLLSDEMLQGKCLTFFSKKLLKSEYNDFIKNRLTRYDFNYPQDVKLAINEYKQKITELNS